MSAPSPVVVIGAGGAGIIAAWQAALSGAPVHLLERNPRPGVKILISGGGKCNITHAGRPGDFLGVFRTREARFLKHALHRFTPDAMVDLLAQEGLASRPRENGRVFPTNGTARDVMIALERLLVRNHVVMRLHTRVDRIGIDERGVCGVETEKGPIASRHIIVATGGVSYRKTGTTGDGMTWARTLGHTVVGPSPALAPIGVTPAPPRAWHGVALRAGRLFAVTGDRTIAHWDDDILFSHEGITGPAALEISRDVAEELRNGPVHLKYALLPGVEYQEADITVSRRIMEEPGRELGNITRDWVPARLVEKFLADAGIDPATRGAQLTRDQRRRVTHQLCGWDLGKVTSVPIDRGEVSAGGISLTDVDPRTMRSRIVAGLWLCGEVLDIAGPVGGYNLQAAFSTGFVAGEDVARSWHGEFGAEEDC